MATSKEILNQVNDVTECSICRETMRKPKILECVHTFCLDCLEQYGKYKLPGDLIPCPLCRSEFTVPVDGFSDLPTNFFIERLLEAQMTKRGEDLKEANCDVCLSMKEETTPASKYCVECQENMCDQCLLFHTHMKSLKSHELIRVMPNRALPKVDQLDSLHLDKSSSNNNCKQHQTEEMKIYCLDCKSVCCVMCLIQNHQSHKFSDVNSIVEELKQQIKNNIGNVEKLVSAVVEQMEYLESNLKNFTATIDKTETEIVQRGEEIKHLVDVHMEYLLNDLNSKKLNKLKEFENVKEEMHLEKICLESFITYSKVVLDRAVACDIADVANDLNVRANKLEKQAIQKIGTEINVSFVSSDLQTFKADDRNIIGNICCNFEKAVVERKAPDAESILVSQIKIGTTKRKVFDAESILTSPVEMKTAASPSMNYDQDPTLIKTIPFDRQVVGMAIIKIELFIALENSSALKVYNSDSFGFKRDLKVDGLLVPKFLSASNNFLFIFEDNSKCLVRVQLPGETITKWSFRCGVSGLSVTEKGNLLVTFIDNKIAEYNALTGYLEKEIINLKQAPTTKCQHAVQLKDGRILICAERAHTSFGYGYNVCLCDNSGGEVKMYMDYHKGPKLDKPTPLVVDQSGLILFLDGSDGSLQLVDSELKQIKKIKLQQRSPSNLYLDKENLKLYIADNNRYIVAIYCFKMSMKCQLTRTLRYINLE